MMLRIKLISSHTYEVYYFLASLHKNDLQKSRQKRRSMRHDFVTEPNKRSFMNKLKPAIPNEPTQTHQPKPIDQNHLKPTKPSESKKKNEAKPIVPNERSQTNKTKRTNPNEPTRTNQPEKPTQSN